MNYKVLYRKYRPTNFENIIGQEYIIRTLQNSIINNNISHAYIFSGPRGTGKTSTAKVFSKAINCINNQNGSPCGDCDFCTNFAENPDVIEIDAASNNGVDEIRGLIDNIKLTPTNGKYKVYIIDEVHMLTTSAFNALLLTLEEPPSHAIFVLATTNIENVPITILSRCQRFDFQKITVENIVGALKNICEKENILAEEAALFEIAYLSEGGMRDALSLLDQLSKNKQQITLDLVEKQIKTISHKGIFELLETLENNDVESCLTLINEYKNRATDYKTLIKKIIDISSQKAKNIKKTGKYKRLNFDDYKRLILELSECLSKINVNVDAYTIVEMVFLEYLETKSDSTNDNNSVNISSNDKLIDKSKKPEETNVCDENFDSELVNIRINNCFVNAQKGYLEEAKKLLNDFNQSVSIDGKVKGILMDSVVAAASDKYLILMVQTEHAADKANKLLVEIEKALNKETKQNYKVIFISEEKWKKEKQQYIMNLKTNKKYELIDEQVDTNEPTEPIINDVFDISKVEII